MKPRDVTILLAVILMAWYGGLGPGLLGDLLQLEGHAAERGGEPVHVVGGYAIEQAVAAVAVGRGGGHRGLSGRTAAPDAPG